MKKYKYLIFLSLAFCSLFLEFCKSTECLEKGQRYYIKDIAPDWPFVLKINWWNHPGAWNYDTVTVDSGGIIQKRIRFIMQSAFGDDNPCPHLYGEKIDFQYSEPNPSKPSSPSYGNPWYAVSPFFTFSNHIPGFNLGNSNSLLIEMPLDSINGHYYMLRIV